MVKNSILLRLIAAAGVLSGFSAPVSAQPEEVPVPQAKVLVVDYFSRGVNVPPMYAEAVRKGVLDGFARRGRHKLVDAQAVAELRAVNPGVIASPYAIVGNPQDAAQRRAEAIRSLDTRYVLAGEVRDFQFKREAVAGGYRFTTMMVFFLTSYDLLSGEVSSPEEFRLVGTGSSPQEADKRALESIAAKMEFYIDRQYKFEAGILRVEPPTSKGKYKELYIHCGSTVGVQNGDLFKVYVAGEVAGAPTFTPVGKIRAREVCGPDVTRCTISSGGEEIARAFDVGQTLVAVSDGKALF